MKRKPTPYQRIMRAAQRGAGVRLTAQEVRELSCDDAISTAAARDEEWTDNPELAAAWDAFEGAMTFDEEIRARQRLVEMGELPPHEA